MTTEYDIKETRTALIGLFEDRFACIQGEPKAWFQIPQRDGDSVRGIYVVYAVKGKVLVEVRDYFIKQVIIPLAEKAQNEPFLYWRMASQVDVSKDRDFFKIYTRICVLDNNLNPVIIDDMIKTEGSICAYSAGAY